ncbi:hypothetical protein L2E82_20633 [Cichorium intybus]|uniref:Uncharacterized protein n=1 Tax=Cichorium intybus TaxID=13427 RepID=A0ACB9DTF8_CICIN|nr:hypothetical protein L2E82_20633 [Cichorium intybus]
MQTSSHCITQKAYTADSRNKRVDKYVGEWGLSVFFYSSIKMGVPASLLQQIVRRSGLGYLFRVKYISTQGSRMTLMNQC